MTSRQTDSGAQATAHTDCAFAANGAAISAQAFYALACDPKRNIAVEACAGAGKTWMLVSRMLRILLETDCQPHEILAMTFTKKAAAQMQARLEDVLQDLARMSAQDCAQELVLRGIPSEQATQWVDKAQSLYAKWLQTPRTSQIRTFHSWFASLIQAAPLALLGALRIPINGQLQEDTSPIVSRTWPLFYATLEKTPDLRDDFNYLVLSYGRHGVENILRQALEKQIDFQFALRAGSAQQSVATWQQQFGSYAHESQLEAIVVSAYALERFACAAKALKSATQKTRRECGERLEQALATFAASRLQQAQGHTLQASPRAAPDESTSHFIRSLLKILFTKAAAPRKLGDDPDVALAMELLQTYCDATLQHEASELQSRMIRLTACLLEHYQEVKWREGWLDMGDVERAAHILLTDEVVSAWMQERLDSRIRQLLVDEFQDTNPLQWQALSLWLSSYAGAGSGRDIRVFLVGDPKQSIYRFRRAQPQVFSAAQRFIQYELGGTVLSTDHTRRNALSVIEAVNGVMQGAMYNGELEGFRPHTTHSQAKGAVYYLPELARPTKDGAAADDADASGGQEQGISSSESSEHWRDSLTQPRHDAQELLAQLEAKQVAGAIDTLLGQGQQPSSIMVLSRKRACLELVRDALRERGIAAQVGEKSTLFASALVQDLVALLDILVSSGHNLSLAQVLKSPLFGWSDEELMALAQSLKTDTAIPCAASPELASWWNALEGHSPACYQTLAQWRRWVQELPVHDALQKICDAHDVLARYMAVATPAQRTVYQSQLADLLAAALTWQSGRFISAYGFIRALKKGEFPATAVSEPDAVRLLTIHSAKGLEAHTVFVLDTQAAPPARESMTTLVDWQGEDAAPRLFAFLARESQPPRGLKDAVRQEREAKAKEELNALYVALTRAEHTLVFSSIQARGQHTSWWQRLLPYAQPWPYQIHERTAQTDAERDHTLAQRDEGAFIFFEPPALASSEFLPDEQGGVGAMEPHTPLLLNETLDARMGQVMHKLLEWQAQGVLDSDSIPDSILEHCMDRFDLEREHCETCYQRAKEIVRGECAWAWDARSLDWAANEQEFVVPQSLAAKYGWGGASFEQPPLEDEVVLRIDRIVRRKSDGSYWIFDFKSAVLPAQNPQYRKQMRLYMDAVRLAFTVEAVYAVLIGADGRAWPVEKTFAPPLHF